jgi:uncharacterized pyridoxamine 5'-phosphate oxidase family protein
MLLVNYAECMPITLTQQSEKITNFLNNHHIGVLSTATKDGKPHAATVYFAIDIDLNFYFITREGTTKQKNLSDNPSAAIAVFDPKTQSTVQVQGTAREVDPKLFDEVFQRILRTTANTSESVVPPFSRLNAGGHIGYCLSPDFARLAEYTKPDHGNFDDLFDVVYTDEDPA